MIGRLLILVLGLFVHSDDQGSVYHGVVAGAKKPAELVASKVFNQIPEYKKIKEKGYDEDDAEYWTLLAKANEKFYAAVRKVAEKHKYDVVVEKGSQGFKNAPLITQEVIKALPK